jgi:Arc/MetJ-type ribon-helix-helix transcriptional regulator
MTDMKRITISVTDEIDKAVEELKKTDEFRDAPYSSIIRQLVERGLKAKKEAKA